MADLLDNFTPAIARCHQRHLPTVDAVGRVVAVGSRVRARRYKCDQELVSAMAGPVIHLFDFGDFHPPEIEWLCEDPELPRPIITSVSHLAGGCWQFPTLLVVQPSPTSSPKRGSE